MMQVGKSQFPDGGTLRLVGQDEQFYYLEDAYKVYEFPKDPGPGNSNRIRKDVELAVAMAAASGNPIGELPVGKKKGPKKFGGVVKKDESWDNPPTV